MTWSAHFGGKPSELKTEIANRDLGAEAQPADAVKAFITAQVPSADGDADTEWNISVSGSHFVSTDGNQRGAGLNVSVNKAT